MAKATQLERSAFRPINFLIETREEADALYHLLNNTGDLVKYYDRHGIQGTNKTETMRVNTELWNAFRKVHAH